MDGMSCPIGVRALVVVLWAGMSMAQDLRIVDGPITGGQFVTDTSRGRIVVVGNAGDTREWDGRRWLRRPIAEHPEGYGLHVFDEAARSVLALRLGAGFDTWSYDGVAWRQLHPAHTPPGAGGSPSLVFDVVRQRPLVCFGNDAFGFLNGTWEWTGIDWVQLQPPVSPPARASAALACDRSRGVVVLFGGEGPSAGSSLPGLLDDTWEWNGSTWQQQQVIFHPSARSRHAMGCDDSRQRVVLFGGYDGTGVLNDVWEYDGSWHPITPAGLLPPASSLGCLVPDPVSTELVLLFSGDINTGFRWNGVRWQRYADLPTPLALRFYIGAAWEPATAGIVTFGGQPDLAASQPPTSETWRWDGRSWTQLQVAGPPGRIRPAMWNDFTQVFLFGGGSLSAPDYFSTNIPLGDTWRWDGVSWTPVIPSTLPPPRDGAAAAFDLARSRAVLFGGNNAGVMLDDTWTFDGVNWQLENPTSRPHARQWHGLAGDFPRGRVVLFGGWDPTTPPTPFNDTWEWDGANWTQVTTAFSPPALGIGPIDYDARLRRVVLVQMDVNRQATAFSYDGANWSPIPLASQVPLPWAPKVVHRLGGATEVIVFSTLRELSLFPALVDRYGSDCGTDPLLLTARSLPQLGAGEFGLDALHAPGGGPVLFAFGANNVDVPIGPCRQLVAPVVASVILLANSGGFATLDVPIPPSASLFGAALFAQSATLDPSLSIGFRTSAGLHLVVGD
jgi:hypothetical protein